MPPPLSHPPPHPLSLCDALRVVHLAQRVLRPWCFQVACFHCDDVKTFHAAISRGRCTDIRVRDQTSARSPCKSSASASAAGHAKYSQLHHGLQPERARLECQAPHLAVLALLLLPRPPRTPSLRQSASVSAAARAQQDSLGRSGLTGVRRQAERRRHCRAGVGAALRHEGCQPHRRRRLARSSRGARRRRPRASAHASLGCSC